MSGGPEKRGMWLAAARHLVRPPIAVCRRWSRVQATSIPHSSPLVGLSPADVYRNPPALACPLAPGEHGIAKPGHEGAGRPYHFKVRCGGIAMLETARALLVGCPSEYPGRLMLQPALKPRNRNCELIQMHSNAQTNTQRLACLQSALFQTTRQSTPTTSGPALLSHN